MFKCSGRPIIAVLFLLFLSLSARAQDMEVGITGGGAYYLGDLNPGTPFLNSHFSFGALVRYNIDERWSVKSAIVHGSVSGDQSHAINNLRNLSFDFSSNITDISIVAEFNFIPYFTGSERNRISPYLYAGISGFVYRTDGTLANSNSGKTSGTNFSIPFGLGAKISLASRLGMQVYWEMHKTFMDNLDIVYGDMVNGAIIGGNPNTTVIVGDPNTNDWFSFFGVSVCYRFNLPGRNVCKDLRN